MAKKSKSKGKQGGKGPEQGTPMDVSNHPANNVPDPMGGAFQGLGLNPMYGGGGPDMSQYGA